MELYNCLGCDAGIRTTQGSPLCYRELADAGLCMVDRIDGPNLVCPDCTRDVEHALDFLKRMAEDGYAGACFSMMPEV